MLEMVKKTDNDEEKLYELTQVMAQLAIKRG
jgi:hypothetical protein